MFCFHILLGSDLKSQDLPIMSESFWVINFWDWPEAKAKEVSEVRLIVILE